MAPAGKDADVIKALSHPVRRQIMVLLIKVVKETPRRGAIERHYQAVSRKITVRQVIDWLLQADGQRPKGWEARVVEIDAEGSAAVENAIAGFWAEIDRISRASGDGRDTGSDPVTRTAIAQLHTRLS